MADRVNWEQVERLWNDSSVHNMIWSPYGLPSIVHGSRSMFSLEDVDIQPAWNVPKKIAISSAITGGMYDNLSNPNHPMTLDQIYTSARECCLAGAPIVHVHVRNDEGYSVFNAEQYRSVLGRLKAEFPDVFFDTCLVAGEPTVYQEMIDFLDEGLIEATPVNCNALLYGDTMFCKPPHMIIKKADDLQKAGCKPLLAVYTDGDVENANRFLIKNGLLEKPYCWVIVPGVPGCIPMNDPGSMIRGLMNTYSNIMAIDDTANVMVCAGGRASSYVATLSILLGLNIRVGMEDTPWKWPHRNEYIQNNAEEFKRYKLLAELLGRELMTADEYRAVMGIRKA